MRYLNIIPVINLRKEPSEKSELVTQLLFGEIYTLLDRRGSWLLARCEHDHYEGWLSMAQHSNLVDTGENLYHRWHISRPVFEVNLGSNSNRFIPFGSHLAPLQHDITAEMLENWHNSGSIVRSDHLSSERIIKFSKMLLGSPYLWGGRNPMGYDCSGYVQVVFKTAGIALPRDASQQATVGQLVDFVEQSKAGDLAFFDNDNGEIIHVGILDGSDSIYHSSGMVRCDSIDAHGIFNKQWKRHTHKLRFIKRII